MLLKELLGVSLTNPSILSEAQFSGTYQFLGEYPWHPSFKEFHEENSSGGRWKVPIHSIVTKYGCEKGDYDFSLDSTVSLKLPSAWLIDLMNLNLTDGDTLEYADQQGSVIFFDPSVRKPGWTSKTQLNHSSRVHRFTPYLTPGDGDHIQMA